jgi:hypothetical protein
VTEVFNIRQYDQSRVNSAPQELDLGVACSGQSSTRQAMRRTWPSNTSLDRRLPPRERRGAGLVPHEPRRLRLMPVALVALDVRGGRTRSARSIRTNSSRGARLHRWVGTTKSDRDASPLPISSSETSNRQRRDQLWSPPCERLSSPWAPPPLAAARRRPRAADASRRAARQRGCAAIAALSASTARRPL